MLHDVRHAARRLFKNPGMTSLAVIALALGIGCSTAVFSVVNAVLLRALPYPDPGSIVVVGEATWKNRTDLGAVSPADYLDWKRQSRVFSHLAAVRSWPVNLTDGDRPERLAGAMVSAELFQLAGTRALLGRTLRSSDEQTGRDHVVVLGYQLWTRRFAGDASVVGRTIRLDSQPYLVVGVMPAEFALPERSELWITSPWGLPPHPLHRDQDPRQMRDTYYLDVIGRLRPGVTMARAYADLDVVSRRLAAAYPDTDKDAAVGLVSLRDDIAGPVRPTLLLLASAVALFLIIACANVAGLMLVRASERTREISLRMALGAGGGRIFREVVTESVLLALLGGLAGTLLASWLLPSLLASSPTGIGDVTAAVLDLRLLAFAALLSGVTGILFGLVPALQASRIAIGQSLNQVGRSAGVSRGAARARTLLAAGQIALSLVLLAGAGLLARSVSKLMSIDPGFRPDGVLVFSLSPSGSDDARSRRFYEEVRERLQALPGVQSAGAVSRLPLSPGNSTRGFDLPGQRNLEADFRVATPDYFQAMGIPLLRGRAFDARDRADSRQVAVVNEAFARKFFGAEDPVGRTFVMDGDQPIEIVGVSGDVRHLSLAVSPRPEFYVPLSQNHWFNMWFAVRTSLGNPTSLGSAVERTVWSIDREIPVTSLRTLRDHMGRSEQRREFTARILSVFASLAVVLAAVGLYGVISYSVARRTREFGVRLALGAPRATVLRSVLAQALAVTGAGTAAGLGGALALARLIPMLFGVTPSDPFVFIVVPLLLGAVALVAAVIPARRAMNVDPVRALRCE